MVTNLLIIASVVFLYVTIGFILAVCLKRNDIADVMWGPGIFLSVVTAFAITGEGSYLILAIVFLWALRIFTHIGTRFLRKKEEDFRYATWRLEWKHFYLRSFFQVFLLQGFLMFLVSSSLVFFTLLHLESIPGLFLIGTLVSIGGLVFETVADIQLATFLQQKTGGIMQTGIWRYSRHPNYFGEVTFWWGIVLTTLPLSVLSLSTLLLLISPITITFLILFVSGIPMLEKKYEDNLEFQTYKSKTNAFFPWFPKK